ncbi:MAG: hypothetical protein HOP02_14310 [Methylococcaceae bacterium]|nr:hypothetical protein [Methylococcaceae bacterium]
MVIIMVQDVNVDDQTYWDSVTLKLDIANGTFSIVDAKPKATTPTTPNQTLQQVKSEGYTVDFLGCAKTGNIKGELMDVSCSMQVTNNQADSMLDVSGSSPVGLNENGLSPNQVSAMPPHYGMAGVPSLRDNFNQVYHSATSNLKSNPSFQPQGVPVNISFTYAMNKNVSSISVFMPFCIDTKTKKLLDVVFKDIKL